MRNGQCWAQLRSPRALRRTFFFRDALRRTRAESRTQSWAKSIKHYSTNSTLPSALRCPASPWTVHAPLLRETQFLHLPFLSAAFHRCICLPPPSAGVGSLPFPRGSGASPSPPYLCRLRSTTVHLFPTVSLRCPSPTPSACAAPRPRRRRQPTREPEDVDLPHASPSVRRDSGTAGSLSFVSMFPDRSQTLAAQLRLRMQTPHCISMTRGCTPICFDFSSSCYSFQES